MVIRSWLNNSLLMGSNDWACISTAAIAQLEELLADIRFHEVSRWWVERCFFALTFFNFFLFWFLFLLSRWCITFFYELLFKDFSYSALDLSNTSFNGKFLDNLLLMEFENCFNIQGGWLELMSICIGPLFGFLNGCYDRVFKFKV